MARGDKLPAKMYFISWCSGRTNIEQGHVNECIQDDYLFSDKLDIIN